jgi:NNP family nitrate/nitrite transporter-like MFS transporter
MANHQPTSLGRAVGPIGLLAFILFFNLTVRTIFSPLLPIIEKDLNLSHAEASGFFLLISAGYACTMLLSGFVASALRHRGTILLSVCATVTATTIVALSGSLQLMRIALVLTGMSVGLYFPSGMATVTDLVERRDVGKAVAIHELGPGLSFVMAPLLAELLIRVTSWRGALLALAALGVVAALAFAFFGRGGRFAGAPPHLRNLKPIVSRPSFWVLTLMGCMAAAMTIGVFSVLPIYLVAEKGMNRTLVNTLIGVSRISGLVMVFIVGWLVDRLGPRMLMASIGSVVSLLTILLGLLQGPSLAVAVLFQPMLIGSFFPAILAGLSKISPPHAQNVGVSVMIPFVFFFGGGVVPAVMGVLGEGVGFSVGFLVLGLIFLATLPLLLVLRVPRDNVADA